MNISFSKTFFVDHFNVFRFIYIWKSQSYGFEADLKNQEISNPSIAIFSVLILSFYYKLIFEICLIPSVVFFFSNSYYHMTAKHSIKGLFFPFNGVFNLLHIKKIHCFKFFAYYPAIQPSFYRKCLYFNNLSLFWWMKILHTKKKWLLSIKKFNNWIVCRRFLSVLRHC